jgi:DNA-binding LacI/PurR family transcriptional regulator
VLNGSRSGTRVSTETRSAVIEAAKVMGYRPNAVARSLNTGRSHQFGVYSGRADLDSRNAFVSETLGGMFDAAREHEMNTVIHTSGTRDDLLLELVSNRALDGLVVFPRPNDPILSLLGELNVPAVGIADTLPGLPSVCVDDRAGGRLQAEHLWSLGHRHALYRHPLVAPPSAIQRLAGFLDAANSFGMEVTVHEDDALAPRGVTELNLEILTRRQNRATALVGWNDGTAEMSWRTLVAKGVRVPEDVSIVGFDGFEWSFFRSEVLTSIKAPWAQAGRVAVNTLMDMLLGKPVPLARVLPVTLTAGTTTAPIDLGRDARCPGTNGGYPQS